MLRGKQSIKIRLHGIDAPETGQPFGTKAKQRTSELAFGKTVKILPRDTDRYGRTVAEIVLPDGKSLNPELVRDGLAWHYEKYAPADAVLRGLQAEAKMAKLGLWAYAEPVAPWDWRDGKGRGVALAAGSVSGNRNSHLHHSPSAKAVRGSRRRIAWYSRMRRKRKRLDIAARPIAGRTHLQVDWHGGE